MKGFINKIGIIFFIALALGTLSYGKAFAADDFELGTQNLNNTPENSAKIGDQLMHPEKGWKRYDDTNVNITYNGSKWGEGSCITPLKGRLHATTNGTDELRFNFTGTKLRIACMGVTTKHEDYRAKIKIMIDNDVVEEYEQNVYKEDRDLTVLYEKRGLYNGEHYVKIIPKEQEGSKNFLFDAIDIDENGELKPYTEKVTTEEAITVESEKNKYRVGNEFTTDIVLHNGTNICAEDLKISYDKDLFEYVGIEQVEGIKAVKEFKDPTNGQIRLITASLGKQNAVNGDKALVKLKFRGKKQGKGKVDVTKARIANNGTIEKDILEENCKEKEIEIEGIKDVNKTGEFTLLDLAVDGWYYGDKAENTDKTKFDTDVVENGMIDDDDLLEIGKFMLENPNYVFNK